MQPAALPLAIDRRALAAVALLLSACPDDATPAATDTEAMGSTTGDTPPTSNTSPTLTTAGDPDSTGDPPPATTGDVDDSTSGGTGGTSDDGSTTTGDASTSTGEPGSSSSGSSTDVGSSSSDGSSSGSESSSTTGSAGEVTIYEVQDGTIPSDTDVVVQGVIVTGVGEFAAFVQEPPGGEYSGVFVFTGVGGTAGLSVGDEVDLVGTTVEFGGLTEIDVAAGSITPTGVTGIVLAPELLGTDVLGVEATAEPWEGVLVQVAGTPLDVTALPGFDELDVSDGIGDTRVDEFLYNAFDFPATFPGLDVGATFESVTGPVNFSFALHKIAPRSEADLVGYTPPPPPQPLTVDELVAGDLVITEIMYDPTCAGDACEFFEIYNAASAPVDLLGLRVQDSDMSAANEGMVDLSVIVPIGGYAVLAVGDGTAWPYTTVSPIAYYGALPVLDDASDSVAILNSTALIDATAVWSDQGIEDDGVSWRLAPGSTDAVSNDAPGAWCYSAPVFENVGGVDEQGSPGAANPAGCAGIGIPIGVDDLAAGDLVVTEIMYNPSCANDACEWFEIYNASGSDVDLDGLVIQDQVLNEGSVVGTAIVPEDGYAVLAHGSAAGFPYLSFASVAFYGSQPQLNNSGTDLVVLRDTVGNLIDQTAAYTGVAAGNGATWQLDTNAIDATSNDVVTSWCYSTTVFETVAGVMERGTPAAPNDLTCN